MFARVVYGNVRSWAESEVAGFGRQFKGSCHGVEGGDKPGQWSACDLLSAAV